MRKPNPEFAQTNSAATSAIHPKPSPMRMPVTICGKAARRANQARLDTDNARNRVEEDRKKDAEEDDELVLRVADSEPENRQRNPRERRHRPQHFDHRIDLIVDDLPP